MIVVLTVSCGFMVFELYDYHSAETTALKNLEELTHRKADRLAENLSIPVWEIDNDWVTKIIDTEMKDKQVYAITVITDGNLFEGKQRNTNWQPVQASQKINEDYIFRSRFIERDGQRIGSVNVYISRQFMDEVLTERLIRQMIALLLLALLIVITLVALLNKVVVRRLHKILFVSKAIANGDYSQSLDVSYHDEVGLLADGMNTMKHNIQLREAELKESESRFRRLVQQIPIPLAYVTKAGEFEFLNDRFVKTFGYNQKDLPTIEQWWKLAYPDEEYRRWVLDSWDSSTTKAMTLKEEIQPAEYNVTCKNGDVRIIEIAGVFLGDDLLATCIDLTERKQAEERVRRYSQAMEQSGEGIVITDKQGVIEHINPAFTQVTGYGEEAIGKKTSLLKSGSQDNAFYERMWETLIYGQTWQGKVINKKKSGELYPAMLTISPIRNDEGKTTNYIGIQQNLEKFEELEQQFHQSQKMEAIGTLVGGIAHDFNNTLAGITGNLYLAKKAANSLPDVVHRLDSVEKLSFSAAAMIQQLLAFSRKSVVEMNPLSIASFLKETIKLNQVSLPESIDFQMQVSTRDMQVKGDINQLQQVLMNLINNAYDAVQSQKKPCIRIELECVHADNNFIDQHEDSKKGDYACISVIDNGSGIKAEHLEHIFEPFFTTKDPGKGTGLGMAMVYGAVKTHDGLIDVKSTQGEQNGTSVQIYLPLIDSNQRSDMGDTHDDVINGHGETILLVDDNSTVLETGRDVLEGLGYKVLTAEDGLLAIETYQSHQDEIDLIILDVVMPKLGGVEALKVMKSFNPAVKAMYATGYDRLSSLQIRSHAALEKVISKPFAVSQLSQLIREVLEG